MNENNKLIAEFMGMKTHHNDKDVLINKTISGNEIIPIESIYYHTSWDWLMPVVVKCFDIGDNDDMNFKLNDALLETNIESLYDVVVELITKYNYEF